MLTIKDLSIPRGSGEQQFTVNLPTLHLNDGEIVAITGTSGCGKSTLLEMIGLILRPDHLQIYQLGNDDKGIDIAPLIHQQAEIELAKIRATKLGFMLQNGGLLPFLTVLQNIYLPCENLGITVDQYWFTQLTNTLNISYLLTKYPHQLSIGERQRVAFIRAVIHKPTLLLADEPTSALDPIYSDALLNLIMELVSEQKISVLLVTHDCNLVQKKGFRVLQAEIHRTCHQSLFIEKEQ